MSKRYDFMRIHRAIVSQIAQAGAQPIRFPSTRKLAEQFGVSQPTAFKAVKHLIADGYLIPCQNGGTISNNPDTQPKSSETHIVGIVCGNGKNAYNSQYIAQIYSELISQYTRRSHRNRYQDIYLESVSELESIVRQNTLSGLILISPSIGIAKQAAELKSKGLPTIAIASDCEQISSCCVNFEKRTELALRVLLQENRTHILCSSWQEDKRILEMHKAIDRMCKELSLPRGQILMLEQSVEKNMKQLKELLEFGMKFDGIALDPMFPEHYELIRKHLDIETQCRIIIDDCGFFEDMDYSGYVIRYSFPTAIRKMLDELELQIKKPAKPPVQMEISMEKILYKNGKVLIPN